MPSSRCVLPVPTGPCSTSGLAASPGASTTLRAEAWATRLHGPTTNSLSRCQRRAFALARPWSPARRLRLGRLRAFALAGRRLLRRARGGGRGGGRGSGGLLGAGGLEQRRVDHEAHVHGPAVDLEGGLGDGAGEGALEPLLEVPIRHADDEGVALAAEVRVAVEPQLIAGRADAPGDGFRHRGDGVAGTNGHGLPPDIRRRRARPRSGSGGGVSG